MTLTKEQLNKAWESFREQSGEVGIGALVKDVQNVPIAGIVPIHDVVSDAVARTLTIVQMVGNVPMPLYAAFTLMYDFGQYVTRLEQDEESLRGGD